MNTSNRKSAHQLLGLASRAFALLLLQSLPLCADNIDGDTVITDLTVQGNALITGNLQAQGYELKLGQAGSNPGVSINFIPASGSDPSEVQFLQSEHANKGEWVWALKPSTGADKIQMVLGANNFLSLYATNYNPGTPDVGRIVLSPSTSGSSISIDGSAVLTESSGDSRYLTPADAATTYLTQENANNLYVSSENLTVGLMPDAYGGFGPAAALVQGTATGAFSFAVGISSIASGEGSTATGYCSEASGDYTTASGTFSIASGIYANASGYSSYATGDGSVAIGFGSTAGGIGSVAIGSESTASGDGSVAIGSGSTAGGIGSIASGHTSLASGDFSFTGGSGTIASGTGSTAFGIYTTASDWGSVSFGDYTTASGYGSAAFNVGTIASGYCSTAIGYSAIGSGDIATAVGLEVEAGAFAAVALGYKNVVQGNRHDWVSTDDLVVVGNGEYYGGQASNAFAIHKNGNTRIAGQLETRGVIRCAMAGDLDMGEFTAGANPADATNGLNAGLRYPSE